MRAVIYEKGAFPNALIMREIARPVPGPHEVLVRVHAVSVNAIDYRSMKMGFVPKGKIYGTDIAGCVESAGTSTHRFKAGDAVFGDLSAVGFGGFAEYVAVPESALAHKPAGISFQTAAALPMAAVTALQALRDKGDIKPGSKVLIYGAGGGVGTFSVQLAKHFGAEVTAVCRDKNVGLMPSLGADSVVNYKEIDLAKSGQRFDLILGVNGNNSLSMYRRLLAPRGIYVMVGGALSQVIRSVLFGPLMSIGDKKMRFLVARPNSEHLDFIMRLVEEGKVKPVIDKCYPLHETPEAIRYLSEGHALGKVIINVREENSEADLSGECHSRRAAPKSSTV